MNSDLLALCLTVVLAAAKVIYSLSNETYFAAEIFFSLIFLSLFWFCIRGACDVFTWKDYLRRWNDRGKLIYVYRDKKPVRYMLWFVSQVLMSAFMAFVVMMGSE